MNSCKFSNGILCLLLILSVPVKSQVLNIDREFAPDSARKNYDLITNFFLSSDKQKNNLIDISGNIEYDRFLKNKYVLLALFRSDAVFNGDEMIQNEGMAHIRYRDNDHRKFSPEFFVQYHWNGAWGMEYRNLYGANLRLKIIEKEKGDIYTGIGGFYELERWNWNGVKAEFLPETTPDIQRDLWRINTFLKASGKLSKNMDVSTTSYLQFPVNGQFLQPRWYMEANMFITASDKIEFVLHWDHIRDLYLVVPIDDFYYTFSMGIQLNL